MATMAEIAERSQEIFDEMFTVADILKGDSIAMHKETWLLAKKEFDEAEEYVKGLESMETKLQSVMNGIKENKLSYMEAIEVLLSLNTEAQRQEVLTLLIKNVKGLEND